MLIQNLYSVTKFNWMNPTS